MTKTVIIIPTYNEATNISILVPAIFSITPEIFVTVVDDNSPDGTSSIVENMMKKYSNLSLIKRKGKEGLGKAYIYAFKKIMEKKDVRAVIMMDADFSHDPKYIPEMLKYGTDFHVVTGSRYIKGGGVVGWELWRKFLSLFGNLYCRIITRIGINDCTGGFNYITIDTLRKIDFEAMDSSGYAFQVELKYTLKRMGASFKEIPIIFKNRTEGESKISSHIVKEGIIAPWKMILKRK